MFQQYFNQAISSLSYQTKEQLQDLLDDDDKCEQRIDEIVRNLKFQNKKGLKKQLSKDIRASAFQLAQMDKVYYLKGKSWIVAHSFDVMVVNLSSFFWAAGAIQPFSQPSTCEDAFPYDL